MTDGRSIESIMVDRSLDNVFNVYESARRLEERQEHLSKVLQEKKERLAACEDQLQMVTGRLSACEEELKTNERSLQSLQDENHNHSEKLYSLKQELMEIIRSNSELEIKCESYEESLEAGEMKRKLYRDKMLNHVKKINHVERAECNVFQDLEELKSRVEQLKEECKTVSLSEMEAVKLKTNLRCDLEREAERQRDIEEESKKLTEALLAIKQRSDKIKLDTEVLRKRNAAQMTRLRHQLKEVGAWNKRREEQCGAARDSLARLCSRN